MDKPLDYLAVESCGCAKGWISGDETYRKGAAKDVATFIRQGLDIRRVTTDEARTMPWKCDAHKTPPQVELATLSEVVRG